MIWWPSLKQFDNSTAHTPDIRGRGCSRQLYNLGGHPVRRANDLRLLVRPRERAGRDTKVCKLDGAILGRQDIGALDVPVYHTLVVEVLQTL